MHKTQLDRIEDELKILADRERQREKEQLDRIEAYLKTLVEQGATPAEVAELAADLKKSVDGIQADVDAQSKS